MLRSSAAGSAATGSIATGGSGGGGSGGSVSGSGRRRRLGSLPRAASIARLDLDAAFFWLLLAALVTVLFFLNLRGSNVELNPSQVAEYERRTQALSNSTVYIVEVHRPEGLLSRLSPEDWGRVSAGVDYVAYVYDDLPVFLADEWVLRAERVLKDPAQPHAGRVRAGLGILMFPCGCMLPNAYFRAVPTRLGGMECLLLPGWVLPHGDVHWIPEIDRDEAASCKRQRRVSASRVVAEYAAELGAIRRAVEKVRAELPGNKNIHPVSVGAPDAASPGGAAPLLASLTAGSGGVGPAKIGPGAA